MPDDFYEQVISDIVEEVLGPVRIGFGMGEIVRLKENWEEMVEMI